MSSGERPIGAAKGKRPNTEALCQTPPPSPLHHGYSRPVSFYPPLHDGQPPGFVLGVGSASRLPSVREGTPEGRKTRSCLPPECIAS